MMLFDRGGGGEEKGEREGEREILRCTSICKGK